MEISRLFKPTERDKRYFAALLVVTGVVIYWRGVWDTLYEIPILNNPLVSLFIGLLVITFTGVVFAEFDPLKEKTERAIDLLHTIMRHKGERKKKYTIKYYDLLSKKHFELPHHKIDKIERNYIVIEEKGREIFIPIHRLEKITENNKTIWKRGSFSKE